VAVAAAAAAAVVVVVAVWRLVRGTEAKASEVRGWWGREY
jgi:hypothetical protein